MFSYFGDLVRVVRLDSMWEDSIPLMGDLPSFLSLQDSHMQPALGLRFRHQHKKIA